MMSAVRVKASLFSSSYSPGGGVGDSARTMLAPKRRWLIPLGHRSGLEEWQRERIAAGNDRQFDREPLRDFVGKVDQIRQVVDGWLDAADAREIRADSDQSDASMGRISATTSNASAGRIPSRRSPRSIISTMSWITPRARAALPRATIVVNSELRLMSA